MTGLPTRSAAWREAVDIAEGFAWGLHRKGHTERSQGAYDVANFLRLLADKADEEEEERP